MENEINMESEVDLKGGRGADPRMIASRTKKGNGTMELVGVKLKSNKEREPKRKEARNAGKNALTKSALYIVISRAPETASKAPKNCAFRPL